MHASVPVYNVSMVQCIKCVCVCVMSVTGKAGDSLPGAALALAVERTT